MLYDYDHFFSFFLLFFISLLYHYLQFLSIYLFYSSFSYKIKSLLQKCFAPVKKPKLNEGRMKYLSQKRVKGLFKSTQQGAYTIYLSILQCIFLVFQLSQLRSRQSLRFRICFTLEPEWFQAIPFISQNSWSWDGFSLSSLNARDTAAFST